MIRITIVSAAVPDICYVGGVCGRDEDVVSLINSTSRRFPISFIYIFMLETGTVDNLHGC
jgi:hypothetical protein